jgi:nicotinamidase-related amidase
MIPAIQAGWALFALLGLAGMVHRAVAEDGDYRLTLQTRTPATAVDPEGLVHRRAATWDPKRTAVVICDVWDRHWCEGANVRVAAMVKRMNRLADDCRRRGSLIIHSPSDCMEFYRDHPGRRLAMEAPPAAQVPEGIDRWCRKLPDEPKLPIDDADGGCDDIPPPKSGRAWKRQHEAIVVKPGDAISDSGVEIWNLLEARGVRQVLVLGVHTNMCVAGRPFGLRNLARAGKEVALVRDLTDSMYNPRSAPYVSHDRGTALVIAHHERHLAPSVTSADVLGEPPPPRVLFMVGEDEYRTEKTLPAFAANQLKPAGIEADFVFASEKDPGDFAGIGRLKEADLLVLSVRRRAVRAEQLAFVRKWLDEGRPTVAIRTSSHAFEPRADTPPPAGCDYWFDFDREVLGVDYEGHYANKEGSGALTEIKVSPTLAGHPLLAGIPSSGFRSATHLYKIRRPGPAVAIGLTGTVGGTGESHPVAWLHRYRGGRILATSLGAESDFADPSFTRLLTNMIRLGLDQPVSP